MSTTGPNLAHLLLWAEALESDQYEQGRQVLTCGTKDCCLGVACKVAIANGLLLRVTVDDDGVVAYDDEEIVFPMRVVRWYGLNDWNPMLTLDNETYYAAEWNDWRHATFGTIARAIRQTYLGEVAVNNEGTMEGDSDARG